MSAGTPLRSASGGASPSPSTGAHCCSTLSPGFDASNRDRSACSVCTEKLHDLCARCDEDFEGVQPCPAWMCSGCGACAHFHCLEKTNRACPECSVPSDDPRNAPAANDQPANCINGGSSTGRAPAQHPVKHPVNFSHAAAIALPTAGALFSAIGVPVPPPAIVVPTNLNAQFGASSSSSSFSSSSAAALAQQQQQASSPAAIHSFMAAGPPQHQAAVAAPAPPTMAMVQQMAKNMAGAMAAGVGRVIGDAIMRVMRSHRESHHNQLVVDVARELKAVAENMEAKARAIAMRAARQARAQQQQQQQQQQRAAGGVEAAAGKVGALSQLKPPAAGAAAAIGGAGAAGRADWLVLTLEQAQEHARALALRAVARRKLSSVSKDAVASAIEGLLDTGRLVVDEMDPSTYRFVGDGAAAARVMGTPPAAAAPAAAHHHHYFAQGHFVGGFATAAAQAIAVGGDGGDVEMGDAP